MIHKGLKQTICASGGLEPLESPINNSIFHMLLFHYTCFKALD